MDADDEVFGALDGIATTPRLLVVCGFDGALAAPTEDPSQARAEQASSGALNEELGRRARSVAAGAAVATRPGDVVVGLDGDPADHLVEDAEEVADILEELATLRRRP